ncbi:lysophospholipase I [Coprinopsis marcescibilis]|uniref:Acyl-protein thioesterase 1 n=1 Tax=Coprinopsis marcescibilis TaxID=230819 RepID=A0A5C3KZ41_COPMA|nr:lysophospholipase I [Coprinopsis marcescibilis]
MATNNVLQHLTLPAASKHTATVIFVHGLGDTGHGGEPLVAMFRSDPQLSHVKWVLPHSPVRPVKANMGIEMPSWYDIYSFGFNTQEDEQGMLESARSLDQLIGREIDCGIDPSRVFLGGFSQGGTMTLLTGLTTERKLGGLIVLSGWLPLQHRFKEIASRYASTVPIFWAQGREDPLVLPKHSAECVDFLKTQLGASLAPSQTEPTGVAHKIYGGLGHGVSEEELADLKVWLKRAIPATK